MEKCIGEFGQEVGGTGSSPAIQVGDLLAFHRLKERYAINMDDTKMRDVGRVLLLQLPSFHDSHIKSMAIRCITDLSLLPSLCCGVTLSTFIDLWKNLQNQQRSDDDEICALVSSVDLLSRHKCLNSTEKKDLLNLAMNSTNDYSPRVRELSVQFVGDLLEAQTQNCCGCCSFCLNKSSKRVEKEPAESSKRRKIDRLSEHQSFLPSSSPSSLPSSLSLENDHRRIEEFWSVLLRFLQDSDSRVRTCAIKCLPRVLKHLVLTHPPSIVGDSVQILMNLCRRDASDSVRKECVSSLWDLGNSFYDLSFIYRKDQFSEKTSIRLVDGIFANLCECMHDPVPAIRATAGRLLGTLSHVSFPLLLQTFSKKMLGEGSVTLSRRKTGKTTTDAASNPQGDTEFEDLQSVSWIGSGTAGAFIHGLEDESMAVRNNVLDSICELSVRSDRLAMHALPFLVDMFNDSIESVRLNAVHSVSKIASKLVIHEDQIRMITHSLEDKSPNMRHTLHRLLGRVRVGSIEGLKMGLGALLSNLTAFPSDKHSLYQCAARLGYNHGHLSEFIVDELLGLNALYLSTERHTDDPIYLFHLIFVLRASDSNSVLISSLPSYMKKHSLSLSHIISRYPGGERRFFERGKRERGGGFGSIFPVSLSSLSSTSISSSSSPSSSLGSSISETIHLATQQMSHFLSCHRFFEAQKRLSFAFRHVKAHRHLVVHSCSSSFSCSSFLLLYLQILEMVLDVIVFYHTQYRFGSFEDAHLAEIKEKLGNILEVGGVLEEKFIGVPFSFVVKILEFRLFCTAVSLFLFSDSLEKQDAHQITKRFVEQTREYCKRRDIDVPSSLQFLFDNSFSESLFSYIPDPFLLSFSPKETKAKIVSPSMDDIVSLAVKDSKEAFPFLVDFEYEIEPALRRAGSHYIELFPSQPLQLDITIFEFSEFEVTNLHRAGDLCLVVVDRTRSIQHFLIKANKFRAIRALTYTVSASISLSPSLSHPIPSNLCVFVAKPFGQSEMKGKIGGIIPTSDILNPHPDPSTSSIRVERLETTRRILETKDSHSNFIVLSPPLVCPVIRKEK